MDATLVYNIWCDYYIFVMNEFIEHVEGPVMCSHRENGISDLILLFRIYQWSALLL